MLTLCRKCLCIYQKLLLNRPAFRAGYTYSTQYSTLESLFTSPAFRTYIERSRDRLSELKQTEESTTANQEDHISAKAAIGSLQNSLTLATEVDDLRRLITDTETLLKGDGQEGDEALTSLVNEELSDLKMTLNEKYTSLLSVILPPERKDLQLNSLILEVSAGVGGAEAMLFAGELFGMYQRYANYRHWQFNTIECDTGDITGALRSAAASVSGTSGVFESLKFETGTHRVQRQPVTDRRGRMHTSTASVVVLPEPPKVEIDLHNEELRFETCRSSGAGGQNVNTRDSAVRITHENRKLALRRLSSMLFNIEMEKELSERKTGRQLQVGTKSRNEKIRTYNYRDERITDHRIKKNYRLTDVMLGGECLHKVIGDLRDFNQFERFKELLDECSAVS